MSNLIQSIIAPNLSPPRGHYAHATIHNGVVYTAGVLPIIPHSERKIDSDIRQQMVQALENLEQVLLASNSALNQVLSVQCFLVNMQHWSIFDEVFTLKFGSHKPARAVIPCASFQNEALLEVMAVASTLPI